jgi:hypothetical protein
LLLLAGFLGCLVVAGAALYLLWPRSAINRENFEKVQVGMTLAEVEAILGGPERDESSRFRAGGFRLGGIGLWPRPREWVSNDMAIRVHFAMFDGEERVTCAEIEAVGGERENPLAMFRRLLGF